MDAVNQKFIMQVWPRCVARRSHRANGLTLLDGLASAHLAFIQVQVFGDKLLAVFYKHIVTISPAISGGNDLAVASRIHRGAPRRCIIHAPVCPDIFVDRMFATQVEVRANAGEIQGRTQKGLPHRSAIRSIIFKRTICFFKQHRVISFTLIGK